MKRLWFKEIVAILAILMLVVGAIGCSPGGEDLSSQLPETEDQIAGDEESSDSQKPQATETTQDNTGNIDALSFEKPLYAVVETNKGKIVFELFPHKAPETVRNFVKLANEGFYNGIRWHRVVPGFVIQGGCPLSKDDDPKNDGLGDPGYKIKAEFNDVPHLKGTVAMARAQDPDSAGSQFYICLDAQPNLDGNYTVFGKVTEGMDVVEKIEVYDVMNKVYIEER